MKNLNEKTFELCLRLLIRIQLLKQKQIRLHFCRRVFYFFDFLKSLITSWQTFDFVGKVLKSPDKVRKKLAKFLTAYQLVDILKAKRRSLCKLNSFWNLYAKFIQM